MATLISAATGNWTTLATWKNVCTGTGAVSTTLVAPQAISIGSGYAASQAFTVTNGENIEGFALHLRRSGTTGTFSVALSDDGGSTWAREVTVNLSDLPDQYSWVSFKFSSVLTADGGNDYKVGVKCSVGSSGASIYRTATNIDWNHILREDSAPGSLSAGDVFYIMDDLTAEGAKTANTVTMDCLASAITDFGEINIGFGTVNCGVASATNYYLKASGNFNVWGGGNFNVGSVGSPLPVDSTAIFELDPTSDGEFGFIFKDGSVVTVQGYPLTKVWTLLNANAAANATSLTTADSTGWKDNDQIVIASTSRTATETEAGALNGDASGTTLTVDGFGGTGGGIAYAHDGNSTGGPESADIRAEIINVTRNVKIRSSSSTIVTYIYISATATVNIDYVEMYYLGENVAGKRGVEIATTTGNCSIQYCSIHDTEDQALYIYGSGEGTVDFSYNVLGNLGTASVAGVLIFLAGPNLIFSGNVIIKATGGNNFTCLSLGSCTSATVNDNRIAGVYSLSNTQVVSLANGITGIGSLSGLVIHSCRADIGFGMPQSTSTVQVFESYSNFTIWFLTSIGITMSTGAGGVHSRALFSNLTVFGCTTNLSASSSSYWRISSGKINGHATYSSANGIGVGAGGLIVLINTNVGVGAAHTTGDIGLGSVGAKVLLYNSVLGSSTEVSSPTSMAIQSGVYSSKHDGSVTTFKIWYMAGIITSENTIRHTASGYSWKLIPVLASWKLRFPGPTPFDSFKAAVVASAAVTVTAWVRKDSSYNGNAPRLVLVGGYIGGIAADVVDSLSVGADTWEQLSVSATPNEAGVIEWYVDCDGTAGSIYVDDMAVSQSGLPSADNLDYVSWGLPLMAPYTLGAAAAGGLMTHPGMAGGMRG